MKAKFEIAYEPEGRFVFRFHGADSRILLEGLPSKSKVEVQMDVQHVREALKGEGRFAMHEKEGAHFAVLHDKNDEILARTPRLASSTELEAVLAHLHEHATHAAVIDHAKPPRQQAAS